MKPILPTMKERKRYILFKIYSNQELKKDEVSEQCTTACLQFLGELGVANAGVQFMRETWDKKTQTGIIKVGHKYVDNVRAAMALIKKINNRKASFESLLTSGTIKKVKQIQKNLLISTKS